MDKLDRVRFLIRQQVKKYGERLLLEAEQKPEDTEEETTDEENPFAADPKPEEEAPEAQAPQDEDPAAAKAKPSEKTTPAPPGGQDKVTKSTKVNDLSKQKDITDPTAAPVNMAQLKNERIARFIQTVSNTSKEDLKFIINDTSPDTKAKTIHLFLKLIGVQPEDVAGLLDSVNVNK